MLTAGGVGGGLQLVVFKEVRVPGVAGNACRECTTQFWRALPQGLMLSRQVEEVLLGPTAIVANPSISV